jgi:hypothetical protein
MIGEKVGTLSRKPAGQEYDDAFNAAATAPASKKAKKG